MMYNNIPVNSDKRIPSGYWIMGGNDGYDAIGFCGNVEVYRSPFYELTLQACRKHSTDAFITMCEDALRKIDARLNDV